MAPGKEQKFQENRTFDHLIEYSDLQSGEIESAAGRWNQIFGNDQPVIVELACGRGDYAIGLARRFPERNFIGVDIKGARLWYGARRALDEEIDNVHFLRIYIQQLEEWFNPGEIDEIWITFPDPFPKPRDERRRLTSPRFLAIYRRLLAPGGSIHLKTDANALFDYTCELIQREGLSVQTEIRDLYRTPPEDPLLALQTTYEKRFLQEGRSIHYLKFGFGS